MSCERYLRRGHRWRGYLLIRTVQLGILLITSHRRVMDIAIYIRRHEVKHFQLLLALALMLVIADSLDLSRFMFAFKTVTLVQPVLLVIYSVASILLALIRIDQRFNAFTLFRISERERRIKF